MMKSMAAPAEPFADDELLLFDLPSFLDQNPLLQKESSPKKNQQKALLKDILDPSLDVLPGLAADGKGAAEEEEELEWLSNKDAFPTLETSFEILSHSRTSSSGASSCAAAAAGKSPVSVLPMAFPLPFHRKGLRTKGKRRRRINISVLPPVGVGAVAAPPAKAAQKRKCRHCEAEETPQWRAGPDGPKTLCNACGVRYKSGRLCAEYRPANSPTFSLAMHSNSHRRILEMRRKKSTRGRRSSRAQPPPAAGRSFV